MCCNTHEDRDAADRARGIDVDALLAPSEEWRCRCLFTAVRCRRRATGEDLLCDWCRETDHMRFCEELGDADLTAPAAGPYEIRLTDEFFLGRGPG